MAHIHSFSISGLAGRAEPISFTLDREVNVFWGLNGTGKTSMLKILHAALRNESVSLADVPFEDASVVFWSEKAETYLRRTYEQTQQRDTFVDEDGDTWELIEGNRYQLAVPGERSWRTEVVAINDDGSFGRRDRSARRRSFDVSFRHSYLPISRLTDVTYTARRSAAAPRPGVIDDSFLDEQFARHVNLRWQEYNSSSLTAVRRIQQQGLAQILAILFGRVEEDKPGASEKPIIVKEVDSDDAYEMVSQFLLQQGINLSVTLAEFVDRYENEGRLKNVISSIESTTQKERLAMQPQREFSDAIGSLYSNGKSLVLTEAGPPGQRGLRVQIGDDSVPIKSLSSGEKQLLRLMLEVLAAESDTVMIDEPELSMHPDWQLVLVETMRKINPSCQLLLATHSPEVMAKVASEKVFQL